MTKHTMLIALLLLIAPLGVTAQEGPAEPSASSNAVAFDTSYRPSPSVSARLEREFLASIRWSAGLEARDRLVAAFAERRPSEIWQELVASDGLTTDNVVDALTAYWVLNWVAANGAYSIEIDSQPVRQQLLQAFANDQSFRALNDQQKQEMAEGYILNFLVEHAALNSALESKDVGLLYRLAESAITRFRQQMQVDLLSVVPSPAGFVPRPSDD